LSHTPDPCSKPGFTLIELLMVLLIVTLVTIMAVPSLSRMTKGTKVEQAAQAVMGAMWEARSLAQRNRVSVAVLFGADRKVSPAPLETATEYLPERNQIEIWQVRDNGNSTPYAPEYPAGPPDWYPYRFPVRNLSHIPITVPDGIKVIAGRIGSYWNSGTDNGYQMFLTDNYDAYKKNPIGAWRMHEAVFVRSGAMSWNSYLSVLVLEESSGDHLIITIGNNYNGTQRPRIDRNRINKVAGKKITDPRQLAPAIAAWGGDR
jgi:prepilin-type N-terminal cleavage/methylation domain-containing protein